MKSHALAFLMLAISLSCAFANDRDKAAELAARGSLALDKKDYQQAAKFLDEAIRLAPDAPRLIYSWRGRAFAGIGDHKKAILDFVLVVNDAAVSDQVRVGCMLELAASHQKTGNDLAAVADYEAALKLMPASVVALNNFAWYLATTPNERFRDGGKSVTLGEKALKLIDAPAPDALDTLAACYAAKGDFESAIKRQEQAIALSESQVRKKEFTQRLELYWERKAYINPY